MTKIISITAALLTLLVAGLFITAPAVPHPKRNVGDSLDGYWMTGGGNGHGCFADVGDFSLAIKGNDIYSTDGNVKTLEARITKNEISKDVLQFDYVRESNGTSFENILLDLGNKLVFVNKKVTKEDGKSRKWKPQNPVFLYHCSEPSSYGKFLMAMRLYSPLKQAMP